MSTVAESKPKNVSKSYAIPPELDERVRIVAARLHVPPCKVVRHALEVAVSEFETQGIKSLSA